MADVTLKEAVNNFSGQLAKKVNTFISDVSELTVRTYTTPADQVETFVKSEADLRDMIEGKAALRAYTSVSFDGDTTVWVPTDETGAISPTIWSLHQDIVTQAMANRTSMSEVVAKSARPALKALQASGG